MTLSLSIIVPVLDEAAGIAKTLDALEPLRRSGVEVIVVDGHSTDDTVARCAAFEVRVVQAARGRAHQMNAGAGVAHGDWLLFLHADTVLPPAALQALQRACAPGAVWGRFDVSIEGTSKWFPIIAALMNLRSRWSGIATGDQAMFVRRESFDTVGGFPAQPLMEDIELSKRLLRLRRPVCLRERAITSGRRWERRGVWRTILLMWSLRLRYLCGASADKLARAYR